MAKQSKPKKMRKLRYLGIYILALLHQTDLWVKWHTHWFPRQNQADSIETDQMKVETGKEKKKA